jgi:poly-gamma-glutamate synthesis protein (capsule biosynthesis protein)
MKQKRNGGKKGFMSYIFDFFAYLVIGVSDFFSRRGKGKGAKRPKLPSEVTDGRTPLGRVRRSKGAATDSTVPHDIAESQRRHKAASASRSVTIGAGGASSGRSSLRPRKRLLDGVNEGQFLKWLTIAAFSVVGVVGAVLIITSVSAGGGSSLITDINEDTSRTPIVVGDTDVSFSLSIGGTIKLHDEIITSAKNADGYDFNNYLSETRQVLKGDISILHLAGNIDKQGANKNVAGYPAANYPRELSETFAALGVTHVLNANNDALLGGFDAARTTRNILTESGMTVLGTYDSAAAAAGVYVKDVNYIKVGIGSYNCIPDGDYDTVLGNQRGSGVNNEQLAYGAKQVRMSEASAYILEDVASMRKAGAEFIIISVNWAKAGNTANTSEIRSLAQDLIDDGVDVTIGTGSDVPMSITKKKSKSTGKDCYVFYSLGNLFSDIDSGKTAAAYRSMVVNMTVERKAGEDSTKIVSALCHPMYVNRDSEYEEKNTYLKYRVVPAAKYYSAAKRPEIFRTDTQWQRSKQAYIAVRDFASGKINLGGKTFFEGAGNNSSSQGGAAGEGAASTDERI